jgi:rhodanese-related sulfurtransferase
VNEARRVARQALALGALAVLVAAAVHFPLIQRFARGEFQESFFQAAEYPGVRLITLEEAEDLWRKGEAVFLDARREESYGEGHVPRALNLHSVGSGPALPGDIMRMDRRMTLVVYCEGGDCQASLLQAKRLHDQGFKDIRVMTGGWAGLQAAGLPQDKGDDQE